MFRRLAVIALLSVLVVSAKTKTYSFNISEHATVGNAQLTPGQYHLKLDGPQVVLTDKAGNQIDVKANVEAADRKIDETSITYSTADGANRILSIKLGGSRIVVLFE